jgi:hypothetical protein
MVLRRDHDRGRAADQPITGRRATADQLRALLAGAPPAFVAEALDNPALVPDHVVLLLRNRGATPGTLSKVARRPEWTRIYEIKRGLVAHPNTPAPISRMLVQHLYWRDLAALTGDALAHPVLRRRAEELLRIRLAELTVGERIALARIAPRGLVGGITELGDVRVVRSLLSNPRLAEPDVVRIAGSADTADAVLRALADHPRWGGRRSVLDALLGNPRTPVHAALRLVRRLPRQDLRRVRASSKIPRVVRLGAERRLGLTP